MKIYTKKGDKGTTSLLGGQRLPKSDPRIDAYGTIDELNAYIGLIRDQKEIEDLKGFLINVQNQLFLIGSHLAAEPGKSFDYLPDFDEAETKKLEDAMDEMNAKIPEMKNFVLPGGHTLVSFIHIARCVCRRAERGVVALEDSALDEGVIRYLNRLSDYLFVLSRFVSHWEGVEEVPWKPRG